MIVGIGCAGCGPVWSEFRVVDKPQRDFVGALHSTKLVAEVSVEGRFFSAVVQEQQLCTLIVQDVLVYERQLLDGETVVKTERKTDAQSALSTNQLVPCGLAPASNREVSLSVNGQTAVAGRTDRNGATSGDIYVLLGTTLERYPEPGSARLLVSGSEVSAVPLLAYRQARNEETRQQRLIADQLDGEALVFFQAGRAAEDPFLRRSEFNQAYRLLERRRTLTEAPSAVDLDELARLDAKADEQIEAIEARQRRDEQLAVEKQQAVERRERRVREAREGGDAWGDSPLLCNDGTNSPTCTCGGPRRGCCSHHGGVAGCSASR